MSPLTVTQLTRDLVGAADIVRGRMDTSGYRDIISGMLVLKWASDQPGILHVPEQARWSHIVESAHSGPEHVLNKALRELETSNRDVLDGVLETFEFSKRVSATDQRSLIDYFSRIPLGPDDVEFSDVVGEAYVRVLDWFADRAGKAGGEFHTPRSVVRLMVRLVQPEEGQSVYDPCAGTAGMLVQAKEYVNEHSGEDADLALFGQEKNISTWSLGRLNILLHGVTNASILRGDTLADPLHIGVDGRVRQFDRVLSNPPFSIDYGEKGVNHPERMRYGWTAGRGKADLMYVQHVLATLQPDGVGAVVTPHGVLFRGGVEADIRRGIVEDGRLEAVIGIGPNVFRGTAIPACILVLRGTNGPPAARRGNVLFINAEREVVTGRTQNRLEPQHVEKIVGTFRTAAEIPGFSRMVPISELAENDFNLNIRRYVDAGPAAEPALDVRAAIFGGVPKGEIESEAPKFRVFGIDPAELFRADSPDHLDFLPEGYEATAERIQELAAAREQDYIDRYRYWWNQTGPRIVELAGMRTLSTSRSSLMTSFCEELLSAGILDQYQLTGVFAAWWSDREDDFRSMDYRGIAGVIDRWATASNDRSLLTHPTTTGQVLSTLGDDLRSRVQRLLAAERQMLVETYRRWGDRYATSLLDLEDRREAAAARLKSRLGDLGYD